jgi:diguanylate cyclase (GGDEF)-like protein
MKVAEIMSSPVHTVSSDRSVNYVSNLMNELKIGSLIVVDHGKTMGIITSRDVRSTHPNRIAADAMTPNPISISYDSFIWDALKVMMHYQIERLPITKDEQVVGLVTRDTLKIKLSEWLDPLTGLYRAPYIHIIGEDLLEKRECFQLLFVDLNNFGMINKLFGHPVGDDVILGYAEKLKSLSEEGDFLCRYAGDEFVMITFRGDDSSSLLAQLLSQSIIIDDIEVSAAVGLINNTCDSEFFSSSFRDLVSRSSLMSTSVKQTQISK